jgi:hypothetical protein
MGLVMDHFSGHVFGLRPACCRFPPQSDSTFLLCRNEAWYPMNAKTLRSIQFKIALLTLIFASTQSPAQDGVFYGLLRARDLTPFGFVRLDMRPAHSVSIEPGSWAIEAELAYQNTWALSEEVERYLTSLEPTGRRTLGAAEVEAIRELPGENYLLDLEQGVADVTVHYKLAHDWAAYATISVLSFQGGFLDGTIESFHDSLGFSTFGRPAAARNGMNVIYDLKGAQVTMLGELPTDGGFMDPVLGVRYAGFELLSKWRLGLEGAAKIPLQGRRPLLSTGRTDLGVQASLQWLGIRNAFHVSAAAVYYAGVLAPAPQDEQVIPTLVLGYEFRLTNRTNLNVQGYISESVYSSKQTDLDELTARKYQYSLGVRHRLNNILLNFAMTENLQNVNNTPDVGFQLGLAYVPFRHATR